MSEAMKMDDCECLTGYSEERQLFFIQWCPMHRAAQEMKEALIAAAAHLEMCESDALLDADGEPYKYPAGKLVRAVLAKVGSADIGESITERNKKLAIALSNLLDLDSQGYLHRDRLDTDKFFKIARAALAENKESK